MHSHDAAKLNRFNKPSKELLVNYINAKNNRGLAPDQLEFGKPVLKQDDGLSEVSVGFTQSTGWGKDKRTLGYYRVDLKKELCGRPLVVHVANDTTAELLKAIREQYGILLEPAVITIQLITRSFADAAQNVEITGFDAEDSDAEPVEPTPPEYLENRNYRITFKDEHLIFIGSVDVFTRRSMELLGTSIDSLLDLREFYRDGSFDLPKVDVVIPNGELYIDKVKYPELPDRWEVASTLYEIKVGTFLDLSSNLPKILKHLTNDEWVSLDQDNVPFNLYESEVIYNGFVSKDHTLCDEAFNYILAIDLGKRCANLTGILKIGYQSSPSRSLGNIPHNQASILPLFPR